MGLPVGQHIYLAAPINSRPIARAYTPITSDDDVGFFELLVKVYPQGNMSKHLDSMAVGDAIPVQGPKGKLTYKGRGEIHIKTGDDVTVHRVTKLGMIAGGTGITPMLQVTARFRELPRLTAAYIDHPGHHEARR